MSDSFTDRNPIDALTEEFVSRFRRGEMPSISEYTLRYPQWADEIRDVLSAALMLEDLKGPRPSATAVAAAPAMPRQLGDYRILREIGRGGMGVVYEAEQISLCRRVALKVLATQARLKAEQLERFGREARAAGRLHHTNIVPVFGVGETEGVHYYVMQYIIGMGLDRLVARICRQRESALSIPSTDDLAFSKASVSDRTDAYLSDPRSTVPPPTGSLVAQPQVAFPAFADPQYYRRVAELGRQVAEALAYAHERGILHRDVKPANLLLDESGSVWVTDFGLAKFVQQDDLTASGDMPGTLRYSSPERFQGKADVRSDLYGLGLTLYELCVLRPAYDETDPAKLVLQVHQARYALPREHNPRIPRDLETILLRTLAPEPENRYQSGRELAEDLRRFLEDRPILARRTTLIEHAWRFCRRNPLVAGLSAALVVVFLLGFAGVGWQWYEASVNYDDARKAEGEARQNLEDKIREHAIAVEQTRRAEREHARAEGFLDVALKAFDAISRQLAWSRPGAPLAAEVQEPAAPAMVSPEVAGVLQSLLPFYERFRSNNADTPRLKLDTARALRRLGTIRARMGDWPNSVADLQQAAQRLTDLADQPLELAQVHNDLGTVYQRMGESKDAEREYNRALSILSDIRPCVAAVKLEQGRTYVQLGALQRLSKSNSKAAVNSEQRAIEFLKDVLREADANPEARHALARAYHELSFALQPSKKTEIAECRKLALGGLEVLAKDFKTIPDYTAERAEMLLAYGPRLFPTQGKATRVQKDQEERASLAVKLAEDLHGNFPAMPEYLSLLARAKQRHGLTLLLVPSTSEKAVAVLKESVELHRKLLGRYPNVPAFQLAMLEAKYTLGQALRMRNELKEAERVLLEADQQFPKEMRKQAENLISQTQTAIREIRVRLGKMGEP